jgi:hypothetical protein
MLAIDEENEVLRRVLPQNRTAFENGLLVSLLKMWSTYCIFQIALGLQADERGLLHAD